MCTGLINSREIQCSSNNSIIRYNSGMSSITVGLQDTFHTLVGGWVGGWMDQWMDHGTRAKILSLGKEY